MVSADWPTFLLLSFTETSGLLREVVGVTELDSVIVTPGEVTLEREEVRGDPSAFLFPLTGDVTLVDTCASLSAGGVTGGVTLLDTCVSLS